MDIASHIGSTSIVIPAYWVSAGIVLYTGIQATVVGFVGHRVPLSHTRAMVRAALSGRLDDVPTRTDPTFGFEVPQTCPDVPTEVLWPRDTWTDKDAYDRQARTLAQMFVDNFKQFEDRAGDAVRSAAPKPG